MKCKLLFILAFSFFVISTSGFAEDLSSKTPRVRSEFIDLGLNDESLESEATAMNDLGQIAGSFWRERPELDANGKLTFKNEIKKFYIWSESEGLTLIDLPETCEIIALNNLGQVAGNNILSEGEQQAFIWNFETGYTDLGSLGGHQTWIGGLNDKGQVVGTSTTANGTKHAFLWENNAITDLGVLGIHQSEWGTYENSGAEEINNNGIIIGWSSANDPSISRSLVSFIWKDGVMERFRPDLNEGYGTLVLKINHSDEILYLYNEGKAFEKLGTNTPPVLLTKHVAMNHLINDEGDILSGDQLFLRSYDSEKMTQVDLRMILPVGVTFSTWTSYPTSIKTTNYYTGLELNDFKKDKIVGSGWSPFKGRQAIIWSIDKE